METGVQGRKRGYGKESSQTNTLAKSIYSISSKRLVVYSMCYNYQLQHQHDRPLDASEEEWSNSGEKVEVEGEWRRA